MDRSTFNPQIGESVAIRDWDVMEREFGLTEEGNIDCQYHFTHDMLRDLKGHEFIITKIEGSKYFGHGFSRWSISRDMIEYPKDYEDAEELISYLDGIKVVE